jgi:hypothetical protein
MHPTVKVSVKAAGPLAQFDQTPAHSER